MVPKFNVVSLILVAT